VLTSQGRLDPNVTLVEKPFSEAELLAKAGQLLSSQARPAAWRPGPAD
jgi:hypothetical protein